MASGKYPFPVSGFSVDRKWAELTVSNHPRLGHVHYCPRKGDADETSQPCKCKSCGFQNILREE